MSNSVFVEFRLMSFASNRCPYRTFLSLGNRKKSRCEILWVWRLLQVRGAVFGQKVLHKMWSVCGRIVVVQDPVAIPSFFRSFSANWFTQTSQDLQVEFLVNCLPVRSVLMVYDTLRTKKTPVTWPLFCFAPGAPLPRRRGTLPLWRLLFCLQVVPIGPGLVTCHNVLKKPLLKQNLMQMRCSVLHTSKNRYDKRTCYFRDLQPTELTQPLATCVMSC